MRDTKNEEKVKQLGPKHLFTQLGFKDKGPIIGCRPNNYALIQIWLRYTNLLGYPSILGRSSKFLFFLIQKNSGAAPAAVAINENYTKTRAVTLLPTSPTANQSVARRGSKGDVLHVLRPADSLQHNHKNKKRCLDYQGHF